MYTKPMRLEERLFDHIPMQQAAIDYPDAFGLEIELEGAGVSDAPENVLRMWAQHQDHSLRAHNGGQAIEYVFKKPYNMEMTQKGIDLLFDFLNSDKVKVHPSYRTSIHVHVNFGAETFRTIYNFITLSIILDELLVSQNGEHRIGNNFCLRSRDAYGQTHGLIKSIENGQDFFGVHANDRYSSINFAALSKFGSIEFRSLECTTHKGRLLHWVNTLSYLKKSAKAFQTPADIVGSFSKMGTKEFLSMVLGPFAIKYLTVSGYEAMLHTGMRVAQDFAYCSSWEALKPGEKMPAKKKTVKFGEKFPIYGGGVVAYEQAMDNLQAQQPPINIQWDMEAVPVALPDDWDLPAMEEEDDF